MFRGSGNVRREDVQRVECEKGGCSEGVGM